MNAIFIHVIVYSALRLFQFFKTIDLSNFKDTCISIFTQIRKLRHFTENQKVIKTENTRKCRQIQEYELTELWPIYSVWFSMNRFGLVLNSMVHG